MTELEKQTERQPDELADEELEQATGGALSTLDTTKAPAPAGPLPVPYPNLGTTKTT
jgi:hypothetical protein